MEDRELVNAIIKVLENHKVGSLATVEEGKPHSRYMTFFNEELTLYTPTSKQTCKAEEIEKNPYVHVLLGYSGNGVGDAYVEIQGKAMISDDLELKEKYWNEEMKKWIKSPDDPDYIVLKITPETIRLMNHFKEPQTLTF